MGNGVSRRQIRGWDPRCLPTLPTSSRVHLPFSFLLLSIFTGLGTRPAVCLYSLTPVSFWSSSVLFFFPAWSTVYLGVMVKQIGLCQYGLLQYKYLALLRPPTTSPDQIHVWICFLVFMKNGAVHSTLHLTLPKQHKLYNLKMRLHFP